MKNWVKKLLKWGALLFLVGALIAAIGFATLGFDIKNLSSTKLEPHTVEIANEEAIDRILLDFTTSDIQIIYSDPAEKLAVTYTNRLNKNGKLLTSVKESIEGSSLILIEENNLKNNFPFLNFEDPKVEVTVPKSRAVEFDIEVTTGDTRINGMTSPTPIKIVATTGDIKIESSVANAIEAETSTGNISITDTECEWINTKSTTGDVAIRNTTAQSGIKTEATTGDLYLRDVTAASITRNSGSGDIELCGSVKADSFICDTTTGDIDGNGGVLDALIINIETTTGDTELYLAREQNEYSIFIDITTGDSNIKNQQGGTGEININTTTGDAELYFGR